MHGDGLLQQGRVNAMMRWEWESPPGRADVPPEGLGLGASGAI